MTLVVSVVVPTCDRPKELSRCVEAILGQNTTRSFEVVVVDDGRSTRVEAPLDARVTVVSGARLGPAAARNSGIRAATGSLVCFTDDDCIPDELWLESAIAALESDPDAVGVEGPTVCEPFDPLYRVGPRNDRPGAFWTCNVAYRRDELLAIGGFDETFPHPFCEDRDLGARMSARGSILFAERMRVVHPPRPLRMADLVRSAVWLESEWHLYRKHPALRPRWPIRWAAFVGSLRRWQQVASSEIFERRSPRRAARAIMLGVVASTATLYTAVVRWPRRRS